MNTEEDFQKALDADPTNGGLRMIFADYLDEIGDPRGPGYRAMGKLGKYPMIPSPGSSYPAPWFASDWYSASELDWHHYIPTKWFHKVPATEANGKAFDLLPSHNVKRTGTRAEVEDAIALAWSKLTPEEQESILPTEVLS